MNLADNPLLDPIRSAVHRAKLEGVDSACAWEYRFTNKAWRDQFDALLVVNKHPLVYEPGTQEHRFREFVRLCAILAKATGHD